MMPAELELLESDVMDKLAAAAQTRDLHAIKFWSQRAEEFQHLQQASTELEAGIRQLRESINNRTVANATVSPNLSPPVAASARAEGSAARRVWLSRVAAAGHTLRGKGAKFQTEGGRIIRVAFANELPGYPNKWWLGLPDQPTDVAVLLCKDRRGHVIDVMLPVNELGSKWRALSRSTGQIKFNIRRDGSDLVLLIPGDAPLPVAAHVSAYDLLS